MRAARRRSRVMAKPKPEKKPAAAAPSPNRVLPMNLQVGDILSDEFSQWRVIGRPYTTAGGKTVHVRVESVKQPGVTQIRTWGAHERVAVTRTGGA